jgi:alkylation response protein AidB-like acyl-CoA dehydrogenase
MERTLYDSEQKDFGESFQAFLTEHAVPYFAQWERDGITPREFYTEAGRHGFTAFEADEEYGGVGVSDFRFNAILADISYGLDLAGAAGGLLLHNDVCLPYFLAYCDE